MGNKSTILILTSDAGFGHRRAAEALEAALVKSHGEHCRVEVVNPVQDPALPDMIKMIETGYDDYVIDDPALYQLAYSATDAPMVAQLLQRVSTTVMNKTLTKLVADFHPDVIVTTYPAFTQAAIHAARKMEQPVPVDVVVTDLIGVHSLWFHQGASMTFAATGNVYRQALDNGLSKSQVQLTGLPIHPHFADKVRDRVKLREALGWDTEMMTVLIVGSARSRQSAGIARLLDRSGLPLQVVAVSGGDVETDEELKNSHWKGVVKTYGLVHNMPDLMRASDFIVCKAGGLIVTESLACGLPLILHEALPGQEVGNVRYVVDNGAGTWSPGPIGALTTAYAWLTGDGTALEKCRKAAKHLGKPRAAYEIADWICRQINKDEE
jgi:1,2-diacylglycerol 3-beta-galactosyltransferase